MSALAVLPAFPRLFVVPSALPAAGAPDARAQGTRVGTVLFISGTLDMNTPPHQAEEVRWGFRRSRHLVAAPLAQEGR